MKEAISAIEGPFHVVKYLVEDKFTTFAIYCNNIQYLVPPKSMPLSRSEADKICRFLNSDYLLWPELPKNKHELEMAGR